MAVRDANERIREKSQAIKGIDEMSKDEFDTMIRTGLTQAKNGESIPLAEAFDQLLDEL